MTANKRILKCQPFLHSIDKVFTVCFLGPAGKSMEPNSTGTTMATPIEGTNSTASPISTARPSELLLLLLILTYTLPGQYVTGPLKQSA